MSYYNPKQIVSVHAYDKNPNTYYEYKAYQKGNFFRPTIKEGIYFAFFDRSYHGTKEEFLKDSDYMMEGDSLFEKPRVVIKLTDGRKKEIHFKTLEEAKEYADKLKDEHNLVKL